jgi:hypothetical protein
MIDKLRVFLSGKKTYVIGVVVILIGTLEWLGVDIPGVDVGQDPLMWMLNGSGVMSLRAAIEKALNGNKL